MDKPSVIRPKLRHSSVFLQTENGVFFQSDQAAFHMKGKSISKWISALGPYMDGEHTLDELSRGLEPTQREMLTHLVETFLDRGVVKNAIPEVSETLPASIRHQFTAQIAYIDHFVDQPQEKFKAFRESRILMIGAGQSLIGLARSLIRNGLENLFLAPRDKSERYEHDLGQEAAQIRQGGSDVHLFIKDAYTQYEVEQLQEYDIIVYCSDSSNLKEIAYLNEQCVRAGRPFLSMTIFAGQAILGPLTKSQGDPCWLCAQLRLSPHREAETSAAFWKELVLGNNLLSGNEGLFNSIAWRIGHGLGFELFKILSGALPSETEKGVVIQDLQNLEAISSKLTQHPLCPVCTHNDSASTLHHLEEIIHGKRDHELTQDDIRKKHSYLFDPHMGVFHEFADEQLQQIPLKVTRITIEQQDSPQARKMSITSYSIDEVKSAYAVAYAEAIRTYTRTLVDLRGVLFASVQKMVDRGHIVVQPQQLALWSGGLTLKKDTPIEWLPAFSWLNQAFVSIPAAVVYPHTSLNRLGIFARTAAGSAIATTFRGTFTAGLLSALGYLHLQELVRERAAVAQLDLAMLSATDTDIAYLVKSAQRFERPFTCLEVIHSSPISVVLVHTTDTSGTPLTTCGIALSGFEAAKLALLDFVGDLQALQAEGSLPATTDKLDASFLHDGELTYVSPGESRFTSPAVDIKQVEDYLLNAGRDILFVNTTSSDIWNAEALISGTVLLSSPESR